MSPPEPIACIGGGVIGGGWAARFLLHGRDVTLFDPHPEAGQRMRTVLDNAREAHRALLGDGAGPEGRLRLAASVAGAVDGAAYVQESVPEQLELKHAVLREIEAGAAPDVPVGSSTSGFRASDLAAPLERPERLLVAHPFNPVYLLPLVEVASPGGGDAADTATAPARANVPAERETV